METLFKYSIIKYLTMLAAILTIFTMTFGLVSFFVGRMHSTIHHNEPKSLLNTFHFRTSYAHGVDSNAH